MGRFRRPPAPTDAVRQDRAARGIILLNAVIGIVASLVALLTHAGGVMPRVVLAAAATLIVAAPRFARPPRPRTAVRRKPDQAGNGALVTVVLVQVLAVGTIAVFSPVALLPAALLAVQGHLLRRSGADLAAGGSLAVGASQTLVAFVFDPRALTLAGFLLGFVTAIVGGVVVHGRAAQRNVQRVVAGAAVGPSGRGALGARVRYAITLSFVVLLCAFLFDGAARGLHNWFDGLSSGGGGRGMDRQSAGPFGGPAGFGPRQGEEEDPTQSFTASIDYDRPFFGSGDQLLMRAKPIRGHRAGSGLYLRGVVLDTFTPTGLQTSTGPGLRTVRDADDGAVDGWSVLDPGRRAPREVAIEQVPIRFGAAASATVLVTLEPAQAVDISPVAYDPDRVLQDTVTHSGWLSYRLRAGPAAQRRLLAATVAQHPDGRYTALPEAGATVARLTRAAKGLTADANSDAARVDAIVQHFARGYEYDTKEPTRRGIDALDSLLTERRGYCVQYASAAALMLRSQGIPARVVQGFLAQEWIAVESLYDVYPPDVHAWIEVYFKGPGWVAFDPTPADSRAAALRDVNGALNDERWGEDASDLMQAWIDGQSVSLDDIARLLARGPGALARAVGQGPLLIAFLVLLALGIWLVLPSRKTSAPPLDPAERERRRAVEHYARVLEELSRLGYRKPPAQTPREFAREIARVHDELLDPLGPITERVYAARYGDRPLTADDVTSIDAFVVALRGRQRVVR